MSGTTLASPAQTSRRSLRNWFYAALDRLVEGSLDSDVDESEMSYGERERLLRAAIRATAPFGVDGWYCWLRDVYDDYVVYEEESPEGSLTYTRTYAIAEDQTVTLGDRVKVVAQTIYVPIAEALAEGQAGLTGEIVPLVEASLAADGTVPIRIIAPGWGSSGYYPSAVLERDGPSVFKAGTHMYWDHPTRQEARERPERSLRDLAGELVSDARYDAAGPAGPGLYAEARVFGPYRATINEIAPSIGVSIRASGRVKPGEAEGKRGEIVEELTAAHSVDWVTVAGAGGKAVQIFESARGGLGPSIPREIAEQEDPVSESQSPIDNAELTALRETLAQQGTELARLREANAVAAAHGVAQRLVGATQLPAVTKARLIESLPNAAPLAADGTLDVAAFETRVTEAIASETAYLAALTNSGNVHGLGSSTAPSDVDARAALVAAFQEAGYSEAIAQQMAAR